ncbi:PpiC-type peptidyl-prolyl cis-trans isomerase [Candidatus Ruthia magnifica str. Cm (Calyptogena magnifica)]|uniref:PpiC-type peptidyl-prolyl cis-trans isomerase n=1 Tax=Ruthia magnifica subsp. Calyptogena magnifica TaxID=413404 RepID=A1AWI3_RUTMC|nr:peptidylprolyl isomerase [Candidatus Ruthturnera calyptogenae]ABL02290.1 PpiC-type peptidyl-prolyl cis-trans isomerase [Candidatus Ruthia magnifica str. Cm (Calyptogena magnifica)]
MNKTLLLICAFSLNAFTIPNSIIAIVNDDLVTFDQISVDIKSNHTKVQKLVLVNQQIDLILQLQKIKQLNITPKENAINSMLGNIASNNNLNLMQLQSLPKFDEVIDHVKQSLSLEGLRQFIVENLDIKLTEVEIIKQLIKTPNHSNKLTQQIKIAQIAVNSIDQVDSLLRSKDSLIKDFLIDLSEKINKGDSFSTLAKLYSQDASYKNGGKSDWLNLLKLPEIFKQNLKNLSVGDLSQPFKIGQVWRIVKIIDKRSVDNYLIELKTKLIRQKENIYFNDWIKKLRKEAYIEIFDNKL